jgi:hypothetical protein
MSSIAVGTIVAKNYLSFARVLGQSLQDHHPELKFVVVLADEVQGDFNPLDEPYEIVPIEALGIPDLRRVCFKYSRLQVTIVAKPYLLRYLLDRGFHSAVFLDADVLVLHDLDPLLAASREYSISLTPHLLEPATCGSPIARELNILQSGVYNGGFVGVSRTTIARRFLAWWADRLQTHCRHAVTDGMHYDQRWLDFIPAFFDDVGIVRDPGCNVAYWNLPERRVEVRGPTVLASGRPCRFFHFSGFEPERPGGVTRYVPGLMLDALGPAADLFERYLDLLDRHGYTTTKKWPYAYDRFDNGDPIPEIARRLYLTRDGDVETFGDPFHTTGPGSYFAWLTDALRQPDSVVSA